jgi:Barstar (barnase inhibitor)
VSGLAALLAGRKPTGVYHWSSPMRTSAIRHAAEHAGWRCVVLDTIAVSDEAGFHAAVATAWELPESSYGGSREALADLLRRPASVPASRPTLVVWEGWAPLAKADLAGTHELVDVLAERAGQAPPFAVVLHGPGPDLDLVELDRWPQMPG